jgi:hypothetical protein
MINKEQSLKKVNLLVYKKIPKAIDSINVFRNFLFKKLVY